MFLGVPIVQLEQLRLGLLENSHHFVVVRVISERSAGKSSDRGKNVGFERAFQYFQHRS